jgi:hypothetical protein
MRQFQGQKRNRYSPGWVRAEFAVCVAVIEALVFRSDSSVIGNVTKASSSDPSITDREFSRRLFNVIGSTFIPSNFGHSVLLEWSPRKSIIVNASEAKSYCAFGDHTADVSSNEVHCEQMVEIPNSPLLYRSPSIGHILDHSPSCTLDKVSSDLNNTELEKIPPSNIAVSISACLTSDILKGSATSATRANLLNLGTANI